MSKRAYPRMTATINMDDHYHQEILSFPLPEVIQRRIKGKGRVAVKTVGDLKMYMEVILVLDHKYRDKYYGKYPLR